MISLARTLRTADYFTIGFGTMVGVGWLVLMDDWLQRGGPLGAILGFAVGGLALLPIGLIYGRLVMAIPDAGSEIAYTSVFPPGISFATGWMMMLAYLIVCPWEAVAIGRLAAYIFPRLSSWELYRIAGKPVYMPHLALGLGLTLAITLINYCGIRLSASFQKWMTFALLAMFLAFAGSAAGKGSLANFHPGFAHGGLLSVLLVVQIVPYFMTGFEAAPKCAEEASPEFRSSGFFRAILLALLVGIVFYTAVIAIVAYLRPWQSLINERFATAVAFERAFGNRRIVDLLLLAALISLLKIFNGNFLAASRLLFALGRKNLVDARFGQIHPITRTPAVAVLGLGAVTAAAMLLGDAILVPITEVGSMASAFGWLAASAAYFRRAQVSGERVLAVAGIAVASALVLMKLLPFVPGHFTRWEWLALLIWCCAGVALRRREPRALAAAEEI
jgi:amino acid transporter